MLLQVAVSKINKYATAESGDTLEMVERPHGGISFVMVDGQRSGRSAKRISNIVARKAIGLLAEGVRDGAAARAAHDYLYTHRQGKVSATLNIVSVDMVSRTLVLCRNSHCPIYLLDAGGLRTLDEPARPVGIYRHTRPVVVELPLQAPLTAVVFTDGLLSAGVRRGKSLDIPALLQTLSPTGEAPAQEVARSLFEAAYELDEHRPTDDISVLVVSLLRKTVQDNSRHLQLTFPL
ncbi:MAG: serine/threonine-protein phosphatase [Caldilineae bacterium]|nr:MAG: serine/threonine-protein phosphatase [Caldilineae bacterium]